MNGQKVDFTERFRSVDDIIQFYTQAQDLQHSDILKKELSQRENKDDNME
jgi:hypothetical protein